MTDYLAQPPYSMSEETDPALSGGFFKVTQLISKELRLESVSSELVFFCLFAIGIKLNKMWEIVYLYHIANIRVFSSTH